MREGPGSTSRLWHQIARKTSHKAELSTGSEAGGKNRRQQESCVP